MLIHIKFNAFSGKCRWYDFCINFSNIWYDALGSVIRSAFKFVWMFRLRKSERYWSSDDSVIDLLYTYLGGLGFLFNILKLTTHGKWSEIPLRGIEAEISACSLQGTLQISGLKGYTTVWQYEWGTKSWGKNNSNTSYRRNRHIFLVHWFEEDWY